MNQKKSGLVRKKQATLIGDLERTYKVTFGVRPDMELGTYLRKNGLPSLAKALDQVSSR